MMNVVILIFEIGNTHIKIYEHPQKSKNKTPFISSRMYKIIKYIIYNKTSKQNICIKMGGGGQEKN